MGLGSYTINYEKLTEDEKREKAMKDIAQYVGDERLKMLNEAFRAEGKMPYDNFVPYANLAGVAGYPVKAWYEHLWGVDGSPEEA